MIAAPRAGLVALCVRNLLSRSSMTHRPNRHPTAAAAGLALLGCWLAGCASKELAPPGSRFVVSADRAQFYKYGPAQSFGADFVLPKGQRVIMLQRSFGFSKVMTEDGISGWVASEEVRPAPPEPRQLASRRGADRGSGPERMFSGPRKSSKVEPVPGDPLFDMSDLPPPMPEEPALPKPKFRVNPPKPN
jgi:hypothetical protein